MSTENQKSKFLPMSLHAEQFAKNQIDFFLPVEIFNISKFNCWNFRQIGANVYSQSVRRKPSCNYPCECVPDSECTGNC